jgi:hypothetical protein
MRWCKPQNTTWEQTNYGSLFYLYSTVSSSQILRDYNHNKLPMFVPVLILLFYWKSMVIAPVYPSLPHFYHSLSIFLNLFSSWIQLKYYSMDVKQQSINQSRYIMRFHVMLLINEKNNKFDAYFIVFPFLLQSFICGICFFIVISTHIATVVNIALSR